MNGSLTLGVLILIAIGLIIAHNGIQVVRNWLAAKLNLPSLGTHPPAPVVVGAGVAPGTSAPAAPAAPVPVSVHAPVSITITSPVAAAPVVAAPPPPVDTTDYRNLSDDVLHSFLQIGPGVTPNFTWSAAQLAADVPGQLERYKVRLAQSPEVILAKKGYDIGVGGKGTYTNPMDRDANGNRIDYRYDTPGFDANAVPIAAQTTAGDAWRTSLGQKTTGAAAKIAD